MSIVFEVVGAPTGVPGKTTVAVRLVHAADNKPVDEATIVEANTDMGPAGMAEMAGKVTPAASDHPDVFRFLIETGMAGEWELVLTAAVPGESAPVTRQGDLQRQVSDPERRQRWPRCAHRRSTRKINSTS